MDKSALLIVLCLGTLLIGLGISIYQLWSANEAQNQGEHSALAARFGGKTRQRPIDRTDQPNPHTPTVDVTRAANMRAQPDRPAQG